MGKRKKQPQNIIKIELDDVTSRKIGAFPVVVKHLSKDGRRVEQKVHQVPTPRQHQIPPTFNPSPAAEDDWDRVFSDLDDPMDELDGPESVRYFCLSLGPL